MPRELDDLVLSLLSVEPNARPRSAAHVMDRLATIAQLGDELQLDAVESHLISTELVGRDHELAGFARHLENARAGAGCAVLIEGAASSGRSRLGQELAVVARLAGMTTLRVEALSHRESGALMRAVAHDLLRSIPVQAREAARAHLAILAEGIPGLETGLRASPLPQPLSADPFERSLRVQEAFAHWLAEVARQRPLLVLVDDAHATDGESAGALVALARAAQKAPLLLVVTRLLDANAPVAVQQLSRMASRVKLRALSQESVGKLLSSAFGEVPNRVRLAQWLYGLAHGNPGQTLALLRDLVDRQLIRYEGGAWVLPAQLLEAELPTSVEDALKSRLTQLSANALQLARLLALHQGALSLSLCYQLMAGVDKARVFRALDELVLREVVVCSDEAYRLRHDGSSKLLLESLEVQATRELHRALAHALLASTDALRDGDEHAKLTNADAVELGLLLRAGWHFLRGGATEHGLKLLRIAGLELAHRGSGLAEVAPALQVALDGSGHELVSRYQRVNLLVPLCLAGAYGDFRLINRYADELFTTMLDVTGLGAVRQLGRVTGYSLGCALGVPYAALRYRCSQRRAATRSYREAIVATIGVASGCIGAWTVMLDGARARDLVDKLAGLQGFPRSHSARLVYDFQTALVETIFGKYCVARKRASDVLTRLREPRGVQGLQEHTRVQIEVGVRTLIGHLSSYRADGSVHESIEALDQFNTSVSRQVASGTRAIHHALRGECRLFEAAQDEVDTLAAQAGSTWRQDIMLPRILWWTYVLCEDVLSLKRSVRQLESYAEAIPSLADTRDMAHACYLAERGKQTEALERFAPLFEQSIREPTVLSARFAGAYSRILRRAQLPQRAREVCEQVLNSLGPEQLAFVGVCHGVRVEHALAIADLGELDAAAAILDALLAEQASHDNPLVHGLTHKARAEVAALARDGECFEHHLSAMHEWLLRTDNPPLLAQCRSLANEHAHASWWRQLKLPVRPATPRDAQTDTIRSALLECKTMPERLQRALDFIVTRANAERGYLFLVHAGALRLAAPTAGLEPPEGLADELLARLAATDEESLATMAADDVLPDPTRTVIEPIDDSPVERDVVGENYRSLSLTVVEAHRAVSIGAIALVPGNEPLGRIERTLLDSVARTLRETTGVSTRANDNAVTTTSDLAGTSTTQ